MLTDTTSHQLDWKGPLAAQVHSHESWNPRFHILSVHVPSRFSVFHHNFMQMKHWQEFSLPPNINRGGFRGGVRGVRPPPPLKFAKHMLYNVNQIVQQTTFSWMVNSWPVVKYSYTCCIDNFRFCLFIKQERSNHTFSMNESNDEKKSSIRTGSIN